MAMNYYFINSEAVSLGGLTRREGWIRYGLVLADGTPEYHEQFRQLAPGDIVLIYTHRLGVVAIGAVTKARCISVERAVAAYTVAHDDEARLIRIYWLRDLRDRPLSLEQLGLAAGRAPRQAVQRITDGHEFVQKVIAEMQRNPPGD